MISRTEMEWMGMDLWEQGQEELNKLKFWKKKTISKYRSSGIVHWIKQETQGKKKNFLIKKDA